MHFKDDFADEWLFLKPGRKKNGVVLVRLFVYCEFDVCVRGGRRTDLARNMKTQKHIDNEKTSRLETCQI